MKRMLFSSSGFTLIELLVVIVIIGFLSSIGIIGVISFNQNQLFATTSGDVYTAINLAKARAQTQIVPASCTPLDGYQIQLKNSASCSGGVGCYGVVAVCGTNLTPQPLGAKDTKKLPSGYSFITAPLKFTFNVISGTVPEAKTAAQGGTSFTLKDSNGRSKVFTIYNDGRITGI